MGRRGRPAQRTGHRKHLERAGVLGSVTVQQDAECSGAGSNSNTQHLFAARARESPVGAGESGIFLLQVYVIYGFLSVLICVCLPVSRRTLLYHTVYHVSAEIYRFRSVGNHMFHVPMSYIICLLSPHLPLTVVTSEQQVLLDVQALPSLWGQARTMLATTHTDFLPEGLCMLYQVRHCVATRSAMRCVAGVGD